MLTIKWRWWYPDGCIRADDLNTHEHPHAIDSGEDIAEYIVQREIDQNGTDGCNEYEVQIVEPERMAGVYDVTLEWEPTAHATFRKTLEASAT